MNEEKNLKNQSGSVNKLKEELNSRDGSNIPVDERHNLSSNVLNIRDSWAKDKIKEIPTIIKAKPQKSFLKRALIWSGTFFVLALGLALLVIFLGFNLTSAKNVSIEVTGLSAIEGGTELSLDVSVVNNNRVSITDLAITLEYPEGARNPDNLLEPLTRQTQIIDTIDRKSRESRNFQSVLYGERQSVKSINIVVQYKTQGSDAVLRVEKVHEVNIRSAPIVITASLPKETSSGQTAEIKLNIESNSNKALDGLLLIANYPSGFTPTDISPKNAFENKVWNLGSFKPRESKEIIIRGKLNGQENEEKVFKFVVGTESPTDTRSIGVEFVSNFQSVFIRKPFIALGIEIDNNASGDYITSMGNKIPVNISWLNNLDTDLSDVTLEAHITGKPINESSVLVGQNGFYRSQDDFVIWNKNTTSELRKLSKNQSGNFSFTFDTLRPAQSSVGMFKNSEINIDLKMTGLRTFESESSERVSIEASRKIKIETNLSLSSRIVHSIGPFRNFGPLPPKAEVQTTYTVLWTLSSNFNDVENAIVKAELPVYVDYVGNINPTESDISFNPESRTVTWNAGRIIAGTGFNESPQEVAFQISLIPSLAQIGSAPNLLGETKVVGQDTFTHTEVKDTKPILNTRISTDPVYTFGKERVE